MIARGGGGEDAVVAVAVDPGRRDEADSDVLGIPGVEPAPVASCQPINSCSYKRIDKTMARP